MIRKAELKDLEACLELTYLTMPRILHFLFGDRKEPVFRALRALYTGRINIFSRHIQWVVERDGKVAAVFAVGPGKMDPLLKRGFVANLPRLGRELGPSAMCRIAWRGLLLGRQSPEYAADEMVGYRIAVLPKSRGKGLVADIDEAWRAMALDRGLYKRAVGVESDNLKQIGILEAQGFRRATTHPRTDLRNHGLQAVHKYVQPISATAAGVPFCNNTPRRGLVEGTVRLLADSWMRHAYKACLRDQVRPLLLQERVWRRLHGTLRGTRIADRLSLEGVSSYRDYLARVPVQTYDDLRPYVARVIGGEPDVLYRGRTQHFLMSSGTTDKGKTIPCNREMLELFSRGYRLIFASCIRACEGVSITSQRFMYGIANIDPSPIEGIRRDYISAVLADQTPGFLAQASHPTRQTLQIVDWAEKVERIAAEVQGKDIRLLLGIPSYLVNLLHDVLRRLGKKTLTEIWPNLECVLFGGTCIAGYQAALDRLAGRPLKYLGAYVATEAPLGWGLATDACEYALNLRDVLFSFSDARAAGSRPLGIHELEVGGRYCLNTGMPNGFLQYALGDVVEVTALVPIPRFRVLGRKGSELNCAKEHVSMLEASQAVERMQAATGKQVTHHFVYPVVGERGTGRHRWILFSDELCEGDMTGAASLLDDALKAISPDYRECRDDRALDAPLVLLRHPAPVRAHFDRRNREGQLKIRTIFRGEEELAAYATNELGVPGLLDHDGIL